MHKWNKMLFIALLTGVLVGAGVPAQAQQVPFSFVVPITSGVDTGVDPSDRSSGFVGGCDIQLRCTGASVRVANTEGIVEAGGATLALVGAVCVLDEAAPCGSAGDAGTGFVLNRRELVLENSTVDVPAFELQFCMWQQAPRTAPSECQTFPINPELLTFTSGSAQLGDQLPERVVISLPR